MTNHSIIENSTPLQTNYLPPEFVDREDEVATLTTIFSQISDIGSPNLVIEGPRGTGKSHLVLKQLHELPDQVNTCYIPCQHYDTQYKVLKRIYETIFQEEIPDGYHTATLQREIEERTALETIITLDELDFLLLNDGDDLLYYLSRTQTQKLTLVIIASNHSDLEDQLEERTYSSLHPKCLKFEPYNPDEIFDILAARARKALKPHTLHRQALTHIATHTTNINRGLYWLQTAAETAEEAITPELVQDVQEQAHQRYVDGVLDDFSLHHDLLYQAITELANESDNSIQTGPIYNQYQQLCRVYEEDALSDRRISDFLKHLELLNLIEAKYHYGGRKGKTREIRVTGLFEGA